MQFVFLFPQLSFFSLVAEVIEQADYLYGSGETEKLYRLLVQHKNRYLTELNIYILVCWCFVLFCFLMCSFIPVFN